MPSGICTKGGSKWKGFFSLSGILLCIPPFSSHRVFTQSFPYRKRNPYWCKIFISNDPWCRCPLLRTTGRIVCFTRARVFLGFLLQFFVILYSNADSAVQTMRKLAFVVRLIFEPRKPEESIVWPGRFFPTNFSFSSDHAGSESICSINEFRDIFFPRSCRRG